MLSLVRYNQTTYIANRARFFASNVGARISVVFVKDLPKNGFVGEIRQVRPGFARNYLIPQGIAVYASKANIERHAIRADEELLEKNRLQRELENVKKRFAKMQLDFR